MPQILDLFSLFVDECVWFLNRANIFLFQIPSLILTLGEPTPTLVPTCKDGWPNHSKVDEELKRVGIIG